MPDEKMTLVEKLLNPAWRASKDSEWADLDVEQTIETMREAAKVLSNPPFLIPCPICAASAKASEPRQ